MASSALTSEGRGHVETELTDDNIERNTEYDNVDDEDEIVSDVEQEDALHLKSKTLRDDKHDDAKTPSLFDTLINTKGIAAKIMIDEWKQGWMADERQACLQLVNLILRLLQCPSS